jgi:hypothetical protein
MGEEIQALTTKGTWTLAPCLQGVRPSSVNSSTNLNLDMKKLPLEEQYAL